MSRWGRDLTRQYFTDLHEAAECMAKEQRSSPSGKDYLTGETGLGIHAVREHYLVYVPIGFGVLRRSTDYIPVVVSDKCIVIVALIRQSRDVPAILKANYYLIRRELNEIHDNLSDGKVPNLPK